MRLHFPEDDGIPGPHAIEKMLTTVSIGSLGKGEGLVDIES
jgi:hypothetical protein